MTTYQEELKKVKAEIENVHPYFEGTPETHLTVLARYVLEQRALEYGCGWDQHEYDTNHRTEEPDLQDRLRSNGLIPDEGYIEQKEATND